MKANYGRKKSNATAAFDMKAYKAARNMPSVVYCDKCRKEFELKGVSIRTAKIQADGQFVYLEYFTCPHCNEVFRIRIDNEETRKLCKEYQAELKKMSELSSELSSTIKKLMLQRNASKTEVLSEVAGFDKVLEDQRQNVEKAKSRLEGEYASLNEKFSGSFTITNDGK